MNIDSLEDDNNLNHQKTKYTSKNSPDHQDPNNSTQEPNQY